MTEVLNKKVLAEKLADQFDITKKLAAEEVQFLLDEVCKQLEKGGNVELNHFGKFTVKEKAARSAFNPLTREKVEVAAKKVVSFTPAAALKELVK